MRILRLVCFIMFSREVTIMLWTMQARSILENRAHTHRERRDFNLLSRFLGKIPDWVVCYLPRRMFRIQVLFQLVKITY